MGHAMFFMAVVAACLLWSAAFVAAAARTDRTWLRRLLVAVAVIVPPLALAPWVWITGGLVALGLRANWLAPTLTAFVSALVGGSWLAAAGMTRRSAARPAATAWPIVALAAGFVLTKAVAFGTLLFIDNAVVAEGRMLRVEAAEMMAAALPPAPRPEENATPLYRRAVEIKDDVKSRRAGIFSALLAPPLEFVFTTQSKGEALHGVAGVLVAATRARLTGTTLADSLTPGALPVLPRDPFTADASLLAKRSDDGWLVWSVGPDGEDDGGPVPEGVDPGEGNDDVGLRMALAR